jgi:hypothetical protein
MLDLTIVSSGQKFDKSVIEIKFIHAMGKAEIEGVGVLAGNIWNHNHSRNQNIT